MSSEKVVKTESEELTIKSKKKEKLQKNSSVNTRNANQKISFDYTSNPVRDSENN